MKKIVKTAEGIRSAIKSVCNRAGTLQDDIQKVAIACLEHTQEHGDWTLSVELIEGISRSVGVKSTKLTKFFEAMMCATLTKQDDGTLKFVYDQGFSGQDIDISMAAAVKWYDFAAPKVEKAFDVAAEIEKLLKRMNKAGAVEIDNEAVDAQLKALRAGIDALIAEAATPESVTEELRAELKAA